MSKTKKCKAECGETATEASGYCFDCAEETAAVVFEAVLEFTGDGEKAAKAAQKVWLSA